MKSAFIWCLPAVNPPSREIYVSKVDMSIVSSFRLRICSKFFLKSEVMNSKTEASIKMMFSAYLDVSLFIYVLLI